MKFSKFSGALALASAIALSACGGAGGAVDADADGDGEVSTEELANAAEQVSADMKPEPGQYRASVAFVSADIPGAPPEMLEMMSGMMSQSSEFCMTQEMADDGFGEAMREGREDDSCTINRMTIDDGQLDMAMTCSEPETGDMNISMSGTVSPTESDVTMITEGTFGPMGEGRMEMNVKQERIGDCEAESAG